jgi:hypothetical protein
MIRIILLDLTILVEIPRYLGGIVNYEDPHYAILPIILLHYPSWRSPNIIFSILFADTLSPCRIWGSHSGGYEEYYILWYNTV